MDLDLPRSSASVALVLDVASARGVDADALLAPIDLTLPQVRDPEGEVTARQELAVLTALAAAVDDPVGTGLDLGAQYHVTTYGLLGFALASSPTLRAAIDIGLRHLALSFAFVRLSFEEDGSGARLVLDAEHLDPPVRGLVLARDAAAIATLRADLGAAAGAVRSVSLALPAPGDGRSTFLRGLPIDLGALTSEVVLDPARLDAPLPRANAHTRALCEAQCQELLARRRGRAGVAGQVRDHLLADPTHMPDMEQVAADRHVTSRTLRRQLADEGTSFRALVDEVRQLLAEELLVGAGLTVEETAHRVGYAEAATFIHAFRRWHGTTPAAWRRARRPR